MVHGRSLSAIFLYGEGHFQTQALPHAPGNVWQHREHLELSENVRERLPASGSLSEPLKISGSVWEHLGGSGRTWGSGNPWERLERLGICGSAGIVWGHLGASKRVWEYLGAFGSV